MKRPDRISISSSQRLRTALSRVASLNLKGQMRAEGSQKVARVEGLSRSHHSSRLRQPFDDAFCRFYHNGCSDRVDVSPVCYDSPPFASPSRDHVHKKDLRRAS